MAILKNTHLGQISGRLGDIVLKNRKGTEYISAAPLNYKKPNTEKAITNRNGFAWTSLMYSALGRNYLIKNIWNNWNVSKGNYVNKLKKFNKGKVKTEEDLANVSFVPADNFFSFDLLSADREPTKLTLKTSAPQGVGYYALNSKITLQGVLHCVCDGETFKKSNIFLPVDTGDVINVGDDELSFTCYFEDKDVLPMGKCYRFTLYVIMIVKDNTGVPYEFSTVVKKEL